MCRGDVGCQATTPVLARATPVTGLLGIGSWDYYEVRQRWYGDNTCWLQCTAGPYGGCGHVWLFGPKHNMVRACWRFDGANAEAYYNSLASGHVWPSEFRPRADA